LETFLSLNGCRFPVTDADAVVMTLAMASGELTNDEFTGWVHANVTPA
jgi:prophage maintenance system killer protein